MLERIAKNYPDWPSVETFVEKVAPLNPCLVVLFGSLAKEDFTDSSDADMLICFDQPRSWIDVYQYSDGIVQPLVFSRTQLQRELKEGNHLMKEVIQTGVLLYGSTSLWKALRKSVLPAKAADLRS